MKLHASLLMALLACGLAPATAQNLSETELAQIRAELEQARANLRRETATVGELASRLAQEAMKQNDWQGTLLPRPRLGVVLSMEDGPGQGIAAVTPGGAAERAGLRAGDRLLQIDGSEVTGSNQAERRESLQRALAALQPGQRVRIAYQRDGRRSHAELEVDAASRLIGFDPGQQTRLYEELARVRAIAPAAMESFEHFESIAPFTAWCQDADTCIGSATFDALRWRGLRLIGLEPKLGRYFGSDTGVLVLADRNALLAGVEPGDVVLSVDGRAVADQKDLLRTLSDAEPGTRLALDVLRDRKRRRAEITAPDRSSAQDLLHRLVPPPPPAPPPPPTPAAPRPPRAPAPPAAPPAPPPPPPSDTV